MICQSPTVHIVLQKWSLSFLNWCPGGCCHITVIFRYSSDLLRWCTVFQQYDFLQVLSLPQKRNFLSLLTAGQGEIAISFSLSIFLLGSIMNKQYFRWLTSKKCFLSDSCQDFGTQGKTSFSVVISKFWFWNLNYDFL